MAIGLCLIGLSLIGFGLLHYLHDAYLIGVLALALRVIQGVFSGFILTISMATIANDYSAHKEKILGLAGVMMSLGLIISPVVGSTLYSYYGYSGTFYIVGTVSTIPGLYILWKLPDKQPNG
jgi:MFS family permease